MANEPLTDETMARIERHMATERAMRDRAKAQRWASDNTPPEGWQEQHSPSEDVKIRYRQDGATRVEIVQCRRRVVDARLWDGLTGWQQQAAGDIEFGFRVVTQGIGIKLQSFDRRDKAAASGSIHAGAVMADYFRWATEAVKQRIDHAAIVLVLIEGMSLAAVDAARRKRNGYTRGHLVDGLDLYCKQQGWPVETRS